MRIVVFSNPASGRGRAAGHAETIVRALREDGHAVDHLETHQDAALPERLKGADALVLVGGDGTLHHALPALIGSTVPVYQAPRGTENLFAREYGMTDQVETLRRALARGRVVDADVGIARTSDGEERAFAIMCSVGPDAGVVHRLAATRKGAITKWSYLAPTLEQLLRPQFGELSVAVDGREVVHRRKGLLVVANSRQYAARLDPCLRANPGDGLLDVVFFPWGMTMATALWALASRLRLHTRLPGVVYATGERVTVVNHGRASAPVQMDGEAAGNVTGEWALRVVPRAMRVLVG